MCVCFFTVERLQDIAVEIILYQLGDGDIPLMWALLQPVPNVVVPEFDSLLAGRQQ